jgi:hypothetical protein
VTQGEPTELALLAQQSIAYGTAKDVLLVVDDSLSMGDKQRVFASAIRWALSSVTCIKWDGTFAETKSGFEAVPGSASCSTIGGGARLGMITSSLGAGGSSAECELKNRKAHLVKIPDGKSFYSGSDVLSLDGSGEWLEHWIKGVGENGCGYEAPLEAMYRFLIDPEPPSEVTVVDDNGRVSTVPSGIDHEVLNERSQFLRPGSSLIVIFVTDEDDCSVIDYGDGYRMGIEEMPRGTAACELDVNDSCCRSCAANEIDPPEGCVELQNDDNCKLGPVPAVDDHPNLRCFDQKRRFGQSLLFPIERYVEGLTSPTVRNRHGIELANPLFSDGRSAGQVKVGLLGGIPWQLIATAESREDATKLELLSPSLLDAQGVWPELLGGDVGSIDPHLVESVQPRSALAPPNSPRDADPVHGHEYDNPQRAALQHSCTFPLPYPDNCQDDDYSCDCGRRAWPDGTFTPLSPNSPLCQSDDGSYGTTQYLAKAYPPLRLLAVAEQVGGLLGSICPKHLNANAQGEAAYGYTGFFRGLLPWLSGGTGVDGLCLDHRWPDAPEDRARCKLIERVPAVAGCAMPGRRTAPKEYGLAALPPGGTYEQYAFCEIELAGGDQATRGTPAYSCAHDIAPTPGTVGYCYVDPQRGLGSPDLVKMCPSSAQRRLRIVPDGLGREGAWLRLQDLRLVCN